MSNSNPITLAENGQPFVSREAAEKAIKATELDPKIFKAMKERGGWCIFDTTGCPSGMIEALQKASEKPKTAKTAKMKYWHAKFQAKSTENDDNCVSLSVNGDVIIMQRETDVILPDSYLEAADHATRKHFEQKPGHDRKVVGTIKKYMYSRGEESTKEEYDKFMKKGNKTRDEDFARKEQAK